MIFQNIFGHVWVLVMNIISIVLACILKCAHYGSLWLLNGNIIGFSSFGFMREVAFADLIRSPISPNWEPVGVKDSSSSFLWFSSLPLSWLAPIPSSIFPFANSPSYSASSVRPPNSKSSVATKSDYMKLVIPCNG